MEYKALRERLEVAKQAPGMAHLHTFGLVLYGNQRGPVCQLCGGVKAPIVDGKHLDPDKWCDKHEEPK